MINNRFDVIVIGSGIGGLTAATKCAHEGKSVALLEAASEFGGYTNPFTRKGFHFSPGLHYIGEGGKGMRFETTFQELGMDPIAFAEVDRTGFDQVSFPDYSFAIPAGFNEFKTKLLVEFPSQRAGIDSFFSLLGKMEKVITNVQKSKPIQGGLAATRLLGIRNLTFGALLDQLFTDPLLKGILAGPCGDVGLPPSRLSALHMLMVHNHYTKGAYVPIGGSGVILDAYLNRLKQLSATLIKKCLVTNVTKENDIYIVESSKGDSFTAKKLIFNTDPQSVANILDSKLHNKKLKRKSVDAKFSLGSVLFGIGADETLDVSCFNDRNIWHYDSVDIDKLYQRAFDGELPNGSSFFLHSPTMKDPTGNLAPKGKQILEVVAIASSKPFENYFSSKPMNRSEEYNDLKKRLFDTFLPKLELYVPNLSTSLEFLDISTPATNNHYVQAPKGNIYGLDHTVDQSVHRRWGLPKLKGEDIFICGSSVFGAGIGTATASGLVAGKLCSR